MCLAKENPGETRGVLGQLKENTSNEITVVCQALAERTKYLPNRSTTANRLFGHFEAANMEPEWLIALRPVMKGKRQGRLVAGLALQQGREA